MLVVVDKLFDALVDGPTDRVEREDVEVEGAGRGVDDVVATAARSPKLYHEAVSPKPAVFVVYTV